MNILGTVIAALLNSLWQSAAMALLIWAALRFLPRFNITINAATRCAVWWAVLTAVVLLPLAPQRARVAEVPPPVSSQTALLEAPEPVDLTPVQTSPAPSRAPERLHITAGAGLLALFAIWSTLSLFRIAQLVRSYRYLQGIKQRSRAVSPEQLVNFNYWLLACGIDRTARLLISSEIVSPMAVGFRHPAVVVPETLMNEFSAEELDHVILHELAHIARYDDWTNLFARMIGALLPVHPVAIWLLKRIDQDREIACDDWVVAMTGQARPYAASLTRLFELCSARRRQLLATGMADRASHLGERIEALLRAGRDFAPRVSLVRVALGVAILAALVLAGARTPHWIAFAQEPAQAPVAPMPPLPPPRPQLAQVPQAPVPSVAPQAPIAPAPVAAPQPLQAPQAPQAFQEVRDVAWELENRRQEVQEVSERLRELQGRFTEEARRYTEGHPTMRALAAQIRVTEEQMSARQAEMHAREQQLVAQQSQVRAEQAGRANANSSFLAALVAAGYGNLSVDEIIELREHGVTPEFLRGLGEAGLGKLPAKDLVALANNRVRPDLIHALREAFPQITIREIIEAAQQGVRPDDLRQAKEFNPNLTLPQVIRLKQAGVI